MDAELLQLLRSLQPEDWARPASRSWTVRDVIAHLLDGNLRRLSLDRDGFVPELEPPASGAFDDVLLFLDRLNADWIRAAKRLSPRVLIELLEPTNELMREHFARLDPDGEAAFAVSWAGQETSPVWLDVARDYTEKWHHQHQVRAAVGAPELEDPGLLEPLLRTLVWAVPPAYEGARVGARAGSGSAREATVRLTTSGPVTLAWLLRPGPDGWTLHEAETEAEAQTESGADRNEAIASVTLDARWLWRLLLRVDVEAARDRAVVDGREDLVAPLFEAVGGMVTRPR